MIQEATIAMFQYWDRLRDGRPAPFRTQIEPADIKSHLADTFILEQSAANPPRFRLAGTRLCATFGRELAGSDFHELWHEGDQRMLNRLNADVMTESNVAVLTAQGTTQLGRTTAFEILLLPLDVGNGEPRALGHICTFEQPFWLGAYAVTSLRLKSMRLIDPNREPVYLANRPAIAVPPLDPSNDALLSADPRKQRRVHHLVVIEGGKLD